MSDAHCGPGPIILGPANDGTNRLIIRHLGQPGVQLLTPGDISLLPVRAQWLTGTKLGLLATWPDEPTARSYAHQHGTILGRIQPTRIVDLRNLPDDAIIVILTDPQGTPLGGAT